MADYTDLPAHVVARSTGKVKAQAAYRHLCMTRDRMPKDYILADAWGVKKVLITRIRSKMGAEGFVLSPMTNGYRVEKRPKINGEVPFGPEADLFGAEPDVVGGDGGKTDDDIHRHLDEIHAALQKQIRNEFRAFAENLIAYWES